MGCLLGPVPEAYIVLSHLISPLTLKLPGPAAGMGGSLTVTVA